MERRIAYSLYKTGYSQFPAKDYDPETKTIMVELPEVQRHRMPKEFKPKFGGHGGNCYYTPNGCNAYFWNSGLARNYEVEDIHGNCRTIRAGIDSFERMLAAAEEMGEKPKMQNIF